MQPIEDSLKTIEQKDIDFYNSITELMNHLATTYSDKYANSPIDTKGIIYHDSDKAKGYNVGNATKYLQRYITTGFSKSENTVDLLKAIHYCLFEHCRQLKLGKIKDGKN